MRSLFAVALLTLPMVLACGGGAPDLAAPNTFSQDGVAFSYPGNWSSEREGDVVDGVPMQTITVSTANDGILNIIAYKGQMDITSEIFADTMMSELPAAMHAIMGDSMEFRVGTADVSSRTISGATVAGQRRAFSLVLFGVDVPHTFEVYTVSTAKHHVVLYQQVSDEELVGDGVGFDLIYSTLKVD